MTEAVAVVCPMEVVKIRMQAQYHSLSDPLDVPKYRSAPHALLTVVKDEGISALYRGVSLTALRQGTNQAANFTAYTELKELLQRPCQRSKPQNSNNCALTRSNFAIGVDRFVYTVKKMINRA